MTKQIRNLIFLILGSLVIVLILVWLAVFFEIKKSQDKFLEVDFFDVGQGDSIFIETPGGRQVLIDGGPDSTVLRKLAREMPFYDREIDIVVLTHTDADHITGIVDVLKNYKINLVIDSGDFATSEVSREYLETLRKKNISYQKAGAGDKMEIGENIILEILHPGDIAYDKSNNNSVVIRLDHLENSFLFAGDIERIAEYELIYSGQDIDIDVLKVAHHGSKTSSSELFLEKVSPEIAIISVSRGNKFGHPSPIILDSLAKYGGRILRTDIDGDIEIISSGENLQIR